MNPNNGAIIGMGGVDRNPKTSKITDNVLGTINSSIVMGFVVKGAMVSGALMDHVITPTNSTLTDQPSQLVGSRSLPGSTTMAMQIFLLMPVMHFRFHQTLI